MNDQIEAILAAFTALAYPGDENISSSRSIEGDYVKAYFKGRRWQDVTVKDMRCEYPGDPSACLSFMTPDAFRYFFPAYMRMAYCEYDIADAIFDVVLSNLRRSAEGEQEFLQAFETYDTVQLKAIACYAELMSESYCRFEPTDRAAAALNSYWRRYLT